ncbi:hypothetical protein NYO67_5403 [Aspergillus flavus]|nr:hypothetical protein NYO67_5403 [Aspergillus flavus]
MLPSGYDWPSRLAVEPTSFFLFKDLQVSRGNKIILCGLMGLGVITGVFATIRTIESGLGLKNGISDASYTTVMGLIWAGMERNIAMMIGSVPALRPLTTPFMKLTSETMSYLGIRSSSKTQSSSGVNGSGSFPNRSGNKSTKHLPTTSMVMVAMSEKQTRWYRLWIMMC